MIFKVIWALIKNFLHKIYIDDCLDLIDVGASDDGVYVVDNHHLRVNVNRESESFAKRFRHHLGRRFQSVEMFAGKFAFSYLEC